MFEIGVIQTKAGYVGQVKVYSNIVWESEPFPSEKAPREDDRLMRQEELGSKKALEAADAKVKSVLEGLFA